MPNKRQKVKRRTRREKRLLKLQKKGLHTSSINIINPSTLNRTQKEINELLNPVSIPPPQETTYLVTNFSNSTVEEIDDILNDNTPPCNQIEPLPADLMQKDLDMIDLFLSQN